MAIALLNFNQHGSTVQSIFNFYIENSTALYEYEPRSEKVVEDWFAFRTEKNWPILGYFEKDREKPLGFATFGFFRPQAAYKTTVEHSVYVHPDHQQKGIASLLLQELMAKCKEMKFHSMVGVIDSKNFPSILLHQKFSFTLSGEIKQAAYKFETWLDVVFYQKIL